VEALRAGGAVSCSGTYRLKQLVAAIRAVAEGGALRAPSATRRLIEHDLGLDGPRPAVARRLAELTAGRARCSS
jgi:hypothetical protein